MYSYHTISYFAMDCRIDEKPAVALTTEIENWGSRPMNTAAYDHV